MKKIEEVGVFRGEVFETALQENKSGNPMFVINVRADERYIEHPEDLALFLAHGAITEEVPQWIDWSQYEQGARNYMTLFTPKTADEPYSEENASSNYKQVQTAFDWDGTSFDELQSGKFNGTKVLFRTKEEPDQKFGPTTVAWVDAYDANPVRELRGVDADKVKTMNSRLAITKKRAAPAAAAPKASAAPPKKRKATPKDAPKAATANTAPPAPAPTAPPVAETPAPQAVVTELTMDQAWEQAYTASAAAGLTPDQITETWKSTISEIMQDLGIDEGDFTGAHWAQVRTLVVKDLPA
jgi:hypothetical protein